MDVARLYHFVLPDGRSKGQCRPLLVVREWSPGMVNGLVFLDSSNDFLDDNLNPLKEPLPGQLWPESSRVAWATSVGKSSSGQARTFHSYQDCPQEQKVGALHSTGDAFLAAKRDLSKGNPDIRFVIDVPGVQIPWPDGMSLAEAMKLWRSNYVRESAEATSKQAEVIPAAAANPWEAGPTA